MYALHFGIVPMGGAFAASIDGWTSTRNERRLPNLDNAWVSGSWRCWGPDDQATDGDGTLHVVVFLESLPTLGEVRRIRLALQQMLHSESRLMDYAILTTDDWSDERAIYTADGYTTLVARAPSYSRASFDPYDGTPYPS